MKTKDEIVIQWRKHKGVSEKGLGSQYDNTRDCQAFYAGDFMKYTDRLQFADGRGQKRTTLVQFNKVKPYVNAVKGFMAQNRRKAEYIAQIDAQELQQMYSKYANSLSDYCRENANADHIETQQDGDMLVCGYGAIETALTYGQGYASRNPNGEILMGRLDPRAVGWDPMARAQNIIDSQWVYYKKDYPLEEALELFDDATEQDFERDTNVDTGNRVYYKRGGRYDKIQEIYDWESQEQRIVKVYFYQWYDIEKFYRAKNPLLKMDPNTPEYLFALQRCEVIAAEQKEDGEYKYNPKDEIVSCDSATKSQLEEFFGDMIEFDSFNRRVYYSAVVSGNKCFTAYKSPVQDGFTIKFKTGDYDEQNKMWVGMVNSLKEPALYYNKALTEMLFSIATLSKGGVMAERSAIEDIRDFEAKYAKTDAVAIVEDGALSGGKIQPKREAYQPTGAESIIQLADAAMPDVAGIDPSFLGSSENKLETAQLQRQRIKQVTSTLATFFDAISLYQKEHARLMLPLMRILVENNDGQLFRVVDDGVMQFVKMSLDNMVDQYDVAIQEAPDSATQKEERATLIVSIADKLLTVGDAQSAKLLYTMALKYSNLEQADVQKITELFMPKDAQIDPQYVQQLEAQIKQLQDEGNQAAIKNLLTQASLNMVRAEKEIASIKKINADANKTVSETEQTEIENAVIRQSSPENQQIRINA